MRSDNSRRMPLTAALAMTATMLLAASKITDVLNAGFGFDPINLIFAFPVAAAAALLVTIPGIDDWIGVAGGLLMLAAAAADHHQRPQAAATPATQDRYTSAPDRGTPESHSAPDQ